MKLSGNHLVKINDSIIRRGQSRNEIKPMLSIHGAPIVESRYYMPIPKTSRRNTRIKENISAADIKRANILRNRLSEGLARLDMLKKKLVRLESKATAPLDPLKQIIENRRGRLGSGLRESRPIRDSRMEAPIKESVNDMRSVVSESAPSNYVPPSQRYKKANKGKSNDIKPTKFKESRENPEPRDPRKWAELESKILGTDGPIGPDDKISRMMESPQQIIQEGEEDGSGSTGTDVSESTTD